MRLPIVNKFTCTPKQLPTVISKLRNKKMIPIIDYVNEDGKNYQNNFIKIKKSIEEYPMSYFALKLSSLNIRDKKMDREQIKDYTYQLANLSMENASKLIIDAEEVEILQETNSITDLMMQEFNKDEVVVYKTYQMYRKDGLSTLKKDLQEKNYNIGCKLVRGAYYNQDVITDELFWKIEDTHRSFNDGMKYFIENKKKKRFYYLCYS